MEPKIHQAFETHMLNEDGRRKATDIANAFHNLVETLRHICPESREYSITITKLEEASFFAKKAMAKQSENQELGLND